MKALKFYDKQGVGFELYMDYESQSITMQVDTESAEVTFVEFEEQDIDDIIIALVELKNELITLRNINNN